jgi:hypothetical protein
MTAILAGCGWFASEEIDWQAREGTYTYEDAVADYGEPQACQDYADGGKSCTWETGDLIGVENNMVLTFDSYGHFESKTMVR